ncbi:MAG: hypothetical protein U9R34_01560 [Nanoarchaeota archaeon]|nr:hypothetical protein [Nanoarchaeota archaeon]
MHHNQGLELAVIKEINTWKIQMIDEDYLNIAQSLLYDFGIRVARKLYTEAQDILYAQDTLTGIDFITLSFREATKEFTREYLSSQLKRNNFNSLNTAKASGLTYNKFRYQLTKFGINIQKIKKSSQKINYDITLSNIFNPVEAVDEIMNYYKKSNKKCLKSLISHNKKKVGNKLLEIVNKEIFDFDQNFHYNQPNQNHLQGLYFQNDYLDLNLKDANKKFKKDYFRQITKKHYDLNLKLETEAQSAKYDQEEIFLMGPELKLNFVLS